MTMAIPVRVLRPDDLPRSCRTATGEHKALFATKAAAMRTVRQHRRVGVQDAYWCDQHSGYHIGSEPKWKREQPQACSRCGVIDLTVASTVTRDGTTWPPLCSGCSARVQRGVTR